MPVVFAHARRDLVTVSGPDAIGYLQGQLSQDVAALATGGVSWTFVLSPQGKVDGWGRVLRVDDETVQVDVDPGAGAIWEARLRRFLLRTKAEITVQADVPIVAVREATVAGGLPCGWPGTEGVDLLGVGHLLGDDVEPRPSGLPADATEIDDVALDALRIRSGVPVWGHELDNDVIPATLGQWVIDASVSFTKGCFTGQELVARIDSRGGNVPRRLAGLALDGPSPELGAALEVGGQPAGTVTSSAPSGTGSVALAFVPRSIEVPTEATVGGVAARIVTLPLAPSAG
jgi:folate-binding protein YgfZ